MSDLTEIKAARYKEAEAKRHSFEIRKANLENQREYQKEVTKNEVMMDRMKNDYDNKVKNLQVELETKLTSLRNSQNKVLGEERERLNAEVDQLKKVHGDQVSELRHSQQTEIDRMNESHRSSLELAKQKYVKAKTKYDV